MRSRRPRSQVPRRTATGLVKPGEPRGWTRREAMVAGGRAAGAVLCAPALVPLTAWAATPAAPEPWADDSFWTDGTGWID